MRALAYAKETVRFYREHPKVLHKELISGVTVAILQVPESVAFSFVAGVDPLVGLYATVFLGFITGAIGGKPGMISGTAGAMAVIAADITSASGPLSRFSKEDRVQHLFLTMIFVGLLQTVLGLATTARLVRLIPETAMIGFMNGLAIIIFMAQLSVFKTCDLPKFGDCAEGEQKWFAGDDGALWMSLLIITFVMAIMHYWRKVPRVGKAVPASLMALIAATVFEHGINRPLFGLDTRTVSETGSLKGGLPIFNIPSLSNAASDGWDWPVIMQYCASLSLVGLFESVMTYQAVNRITGTVPTVFKANQECVAQGIGNLVSALFSSMGGDAMIGQSTVNTLNGARYRLSAMAAGLFLMIVILALSPVIELIPVAGLAGVLFMIVFHTFNWDTFILLRRIPYTDRAAIVLVTALAVATDLAIAVVAGIVWSALCSSWKSGSLLTVAVESREGYTLYRVRGPLFFGSVKNFDNAFDPLHDPDVVVVDFAESMVSDFSAVAAIKAASQRYHDEGKHFVLRHVSEISLAQIHRTKTWMPDLHHIPLADASPPPSPSIRLGPLFPLSAALASEAPDNHVPEDLSLEILGSDEEPNLDRIRTL